VLRIINERKNYNAEVISMKRVLTYILAGTLVVIVGGSAAYAAGLSDDKDNSISMVAPVYESDNETNYANSNLRYSYEYDNCLSGNMINTYARTNFIDGNGDGICDNRQSGGQSTGNGYVDEDGDGICDNRQSGGQSTGNGYVDEDGDGVCDNNTGIYRPQDGTGYKHGRK
jgi:hypothetical protein